MNGKNIISATVEVKSKNIDRLVYDGENQTLMVDFKSGGSYLYFDVPPCHFVVMLEAESVGAYFARNIKNVYQHEKVEVGEEKESA